MKRDTSNILIFLTFSLLALLVLAPGGIFSKTLPDVLVLNVQKDSYIRLTEHIKNQLKHKEPSLFIINLTSVNCEPCKKEVPALLNEYQKLKDRKIELLFIFVGDEYDPILKKMKELSIPNETAVFSDPLSTSMKRMDFDGVPTTLLVDSKMEILETVIGYNEKKFSILVHKIKEYTK